MNRTTFLSISILIVLLLAAICSIFAQPINGYTKNYLTNKPVDYVNIGLMGKELGTVSSADGSFSLDIPSNFNNDTLYLSRVGYEKKGIKVADLRSQNSNTILMVEKRYALDEVSIEPKKFKKKTLGVTTDFKGVVAGFNNYHLGYELGLLMKVNKSTYIHQVKINFASSSYDTVFLRLNIYKPTGELSFENILKEPVYIKIAKSEIGKPVIIDLKNQYLHVDDDFLVTLEYVRDLGEGQLMFCASLISQPTYYRDISQGKWNKLPAPIGISMSVEVETEK